MAPISKKIKALMVSRYQDESDRTDQSDIDYSLIHSSSTEPKEYHLYNPHSRIRISNSHAHDLSSYKDIQLNEAHEDGSECLSDALARSSQFSTHLSSSSSSCSSYSHCCEYDLQSNESSRSKSNTKASWNKNSEEYRLRRERNNIAVRKSRRKSKQKFLQTVERITQLENENKILLKKVRSVAQDLSFLKYALLKRVNHLHDDDLNYGDFSEFPNDQSVDDLIDRMFRILQES